MAGYQDLEEVYAIWPELSKECGLGQGSSHIGVSIKGHMLIHQLPLLRYHAKFDLTGVTIHGVIRIPYDRT